MITGFDHVHLYAADVEATLEFYQGTLGAERIGVLPNSHGGQNHLVLLAGQFLVISSYPPGMTPAAPPRHGDGALTHGFGVAHLGLNVVELGAMLRRLEAAGVPIHSPEPRCAGPVRFVYFTAPDGVVIELTQYMLPAKLRPAAAALALFNKSIHHARAAIGRRLVKQASGSPAAPATSTGLSASRRRRTDRRCRRGTRSRW